jgi:hypothetical protein
MKHGRWQAQIIGVGKHRSCNWVAESKERERERESERSTVQGKARKPEISARDNTKVRSAPPFHMLRSTTLRLLL